jgi:signal transduction histidine kinase
MLWHVVSNLVNNAVKFGARAGPRRLEATVSRENGNAVIRISDNGIGLAPAEIARAFDRFYQASASIREQPARASAAHLEGMGGTVSLESPGRDLGAVATVTLPL